MSGRRRVRAAEIDRRAAHVLRHGGLVQLEDVVRHVMAVSVSLSVEFAQRANPARTDETQRVIGRLSLGGLSWSDLVAQRSARSELGPIDAPLKMTGAYRFYTSDMRQWDQRGVRHEVTLIGRHETSSWIDPQIDMRGDMRDEVRGDVRGVTDYG